MKPVNFPQSNLSLNPPPNLAGCEPLAVHTNGEVCTSVWELDDSDIANILASRRIALSIYSGYTQPPVSLTPICHGLEFVPPNVPQTLNPPIPIIEDTLLRLSRENRQICKKCKTVMAMHKRITLQCPLVKDCAIHGFTLDTYEGSGSYLDREVANAIDQIYGAKDESKS